MKEYDYFRMDLFPQEMDRLEFSNSTLSKVNKFVLKPQKESIRYHFKEGNYWDYYEKHRDCPGYHYFNTILEQYMNKPLSELIEKCRTHPLYFKHKGFKDQVDMKIKELMKGPVMCERYSGTNFWEDEFVDYNGVIRSIKDHPQYRQVPRREGVAYRSWSNPGQIVTVFKKKILRDEGIHYFVSSFEDDRFLWKQSIHGNTKKVLNPDHFKIPLTNSQLQLYGLKNNTPKE